MPLPRDVCAGDAQFTLRLNTTPYVDSRDSMDDAIMAEDDPKSDHHITMPAPWTPAAALHAACDRDSACVQRKHSSATLGDYDCAWGLPMTDAGRTNNTALAEPRSSSYTFLHTLQHPQGRGASSRLCPPMASTTRQTQRSAELATVSGIGEATAVFGRQRTEDRLWQLTALRASSTSSAGPEQPAQLALHGPAAALHIIAVSGSSDERGPVRRWVDCPPTISAC